MLNFEQKQLINAIKQPDLPAVQQLLAQGLDPNFLTDEGFPISILCDQLFFWYEAIINAYNAGKPLSENEKQHALQVYLDILECLIQAKANIHIWDSEEFYGPLWDACSYACVPFMVRLLQLGVDPNRKDDEGLTILSSISQLWFNCDFDAIDWSQAIPEQRQSLQLLRQSGAKMTKECG